jgi:hypothetical protein
MHHNTAVDYCMNGMNQSRYFIGVLNFTKENKTILSDLGLICIIIPIVTVLLFDLIRTFLP